MFDLTPPYAPDLEWMLQSGQVSREALLEALLEEHYAAVYHLALSLLDDHAAAASAAQQTFARALLDQHRYRPEEGLHRWLYSIVLETCQRLQKSLQRRRSLKALLPRWSRSGDFGDSSPETMQDARLWLALDALELHARQVVLLHAANGWDAQRIAAQLDASESEISAVLQAASQLIDLAPPMNASVPGEPSSPAEAPSLDLVGSLSRRWPAQTFLPAYLKNQSVIILRRLRSTRFRQSKALTLLELALVALVILLAFATLWGANTLFAESPTATASAPPVTRLVTKPVYQVVTSTPSIELSSDLTSTPIQVAQSNYTEVRAGETLPDVADRLGVTVADLRYWNRLPDYLEVQPGQRLINPQYARTLKPLAATPVSPVTPLPPLHGAITVQTLIKLLTYSKKDFNNFWLDATIIDYGPVSYLGPPHLTHLQEWVSENQYLMTTGAYGALPDVSILQTGIIPGFLAKPASDTFWFSEWRLFENYDYSSPSKPFIDKFERAFSPESLHLDSTVNVNGREDVAGRSTIQLDLLDPQGTRFSSLWVDDSVGQILRRIDYHTGDLPAMEYRINSFAPNVDFPQDLFDLRLPWRGGFAQDYRGASLALNAPPPDIPSPNTRLSGPPAPADLDLSRSLLTFQYPASYSPSYANQQVELFAGGYSLGPAILGNPWSMICDRSPDGQKIAYVSQPVAGQDLNSWLNLLDMSESSKSGIRFFPLYSQSGVTELAFSPDSRQLAFFSHPNPLVSGTLSAVDLLTQVVRPIYTAGDIKSLVWSPDGKYLAFINRMDPSYYIENILVVSSETGEIIYNTPLDVLNGSAKDWPMAEWGVDFPVEMGGLDACAALSEP